MGQADPEEPAATPTEAGQAVTAKQVDQLHAELVDHLRAHIDLPPSWWDALAQTPRHMFLPERVWHRHEQELIPIDRTVEPTRWLEVAYSPDTVVTQLDPTGKATSSCSMPYMVLRMLELLDAHPGHRVLEIGTGTGWNAAMLAYQLGDERVVSVELDPQIAGQARKALTAVGRQPLAVTGDGEQGWQPGAPYDRVIATCAAYRVPHPWVEQTVDGGLMVVPWESPLGLGGLLRLAVADQAASGRFVDDSSFMLLRGQVFDPPDEPDDFAEQASTSTMTVDLQAIRENLARFVIGVLVPDCRAAGFHAEDEVWLLATDSWASLEIATGVVRQLGRRRLWDEVEDAYRWWRRAGQPELTRFGITVTRDRQAVWLDEPDQLVPPDGL